MHFLIEKKINLPLDGRLRLLYLLFILFLVLLTTSTAFHFTVLIFHLGLLILHRVSVRELFKSYLEPLFIASMLLLVKSVSLHNLSFDSTVLKQSLPLALRIITAFTLFLFIFYSFTFTELLRTLSQLRMPSLLVELLLLTHRFILLLYDEFLTIYHAQKIRLGFSSLSTYARSIQAVSHALFFRTLEHGENAILSMRQRGYDFKNLLTKDKKLKSLEIVVTSGMMLAWLILFLKLQG